VRDHLTEIPPFRLGYLSNAVSSLIVADWPSHYIIRKFKRFFLPPPEISMMQRASFPLGWTPLTTIRDANFYEIFSRWKNHRRFHEIYTYT